MERRLVWGKKYKRAESTLLCILAYLASKNRLEAARASLAYGSDYLDETIGCIMGSTRGKLDGGVKRGSDYLNQKCIYMHTDTVT